MALELTILVDDKGTPIVKKFRDTSKQSMDAVEKSTAQSVSRQSAAFKRLGSTVIDFRKIAFSALAAGGVAGYLTKLASDVEETRNKFNVVFGEMAGVATEWADEFGNAVGRATSDVMTWMSGVQDTLVPLGYARDSAADLSRQIIELAVDVGSFNNASDPEVINSFTSAIVGNHEAVRKYGIVMTEAQLKLEALESGIIDTAREMTAQEKVQARINLLFKGTSDAQGDALRTSGDFANQLKRLKAETKELGESLGIALLPAMTLIITSMTSAIPTAKALGSTLVTELWYNVEKIRLTWTVLGETIAEGFQKGLKFGEAFDESIVKHQAAILGMEEVYTIANKNVVDGLTDALLSQDKLTAALERFQAMLSEGGMEGAGGDILPEFNPELMESVSEFSLQMRGAAIYAGEIHEVNADLPDLIYESSSAWIDFLAAQGEALSNEQIMVDLAGQLTSVISSTLTQAMIGLVAEGKSINQVFKQIGQTILTTVIGALTQAIIKATVLKTVFGFLGVPMFDKGGIVPAYQTGGIVMGGRPIKGSNEVLIGAQPGEGVVTKKGMQDLGVEGLNRLNQGMTPSSNVFNISINTGGGDVDENFLRFKMLPALNKVLEDRAYLGD